MEQKAFQPNYIPVAEAGVKLLRREAVVVDVRPEIAYDASHIAGAIWLPAELAAVRYEELLSYHGVILYGGDEHDLSPEEAYRELAGRGYRPVWILSGGLEAWAAAGLPVRSQQDEELVPDEGSA